MAAVSIQFTPRPTAWWMAATEAASSCGPQPYAQPAPPIAQAPNPTVVISRSVAPRRRVSSAMWVVVMASLPLSACISMSNYFTTYFLVKMLHIELSFGHDRGRDRRSEERRVGKEGRAQTRHD